MRLGVRTHTRKAIQTDRAGNTSTANTALCIPLNTPPAFPTRRSSDLADDTGSSNSDNITNQTSALTISGGGENGATVTLFDDANANGVVDTGESLAKIRGARG